MEVIQKCATLSLGNDSGEFNGRHEFTHLVSLESPVYMKAFKLKMTTPSYGSRIGLSSIQAVSQALTLQFVSEFDKTMCIVKANPEDFEYG